MSKKFIYIISIGIGIGSVHFAKNVLLEKALKACKGGKKPKLLFTGPQGPRFKPQGPGTNPHDHFYFPKGK